MSARSALCEFATHHISRVQRKSGLTGRTAALVRVVERRLWAVRNTMIYFEERAGSGLSLRVRIVKSQLRKADIRKIGYRLNVAGKRREFVCFEHAPFHFNARTYANSMQILLEMDGLHFLRFRSA